MTKAELEEKVGMEMCDEMFERVARNATRKQDFLIERGDEYAKEEWYFEELMQEQFRQLSFSDFTLSVCYAMAEMEKEHSENRSALNS